MSKMKHVALLTLSFLTAHGCNTCSISACDAAKSNLNELQTVGARLKLTSCAR